MDDDDESELKAIQSLLAAEADFMASENYHQNPTAVSRRKQALDFILKLYRENPFNPDDPFIPLLALTYFDRFFSRLLMEDIPLQVTMLIAISCLSLAWKMRTVRFNLRELLDSLNFRNLPVVEVKKMELRIFSTLDWRMRSTTAFCFVDFFVSLLNIDNDSEQDLKRRVINNVLKKMHTDIEFTKFRPSIMAASALIAESTSSGPRIDLRQAFAPYVNMDELNRCADELARKIILGVVVSIRETHGTPESIPSDEE